MSTELLKDNDIKKAAEVVFDKYVENIRKEFGGPAEAFDVKEKTKTIVNTANRRDSKSRKTWQIVLKRAAMILLVLCLSAGSILAFSEDARAMVKNWIKSIFENKTVYTFEEEEDNREMGFPVLEWIPEGFTLVDEFTIDEGDWCEVTYKDPEENYISFDCYKIGTIDRLDLNADGRDAVTVDINGAKGDFYDTIFMSDAKVLIWKDEENGVLSLLGSSLDKETMTQIAQSITYDMRKEFDDSVSADESIRVFPENKGTIDQDLLNKYEDELDWATATIFDSYSYDSAIEGFELETFNKSFEFDVIGGRTVEVYDFTYYMKADDEVQMLGGMYRGDDGNIRGFTGSFGQIAVLKYQGNDIKIVPITAMDIMLDVEGADEETVKLIKDLVITALKTPRYVHKEYLYN